MLNALDTIARMKTAANVPSTQRVYRLGVSSTPSFQAAREAAVRFGANATRQGFDRKLYLTVDGLRDSPFGNAMAYFQGLTARQTFAMFLLHHLRLEEASPFETLIAYFNHPSHRSHVLLDTLNAKNLASTYLVDEIHVHGQLFPALCEADYHLFLPQFHTLQHYLWAYLVALEHTVMEDGVFTLVFLPDVPDALAFHDEDSPAGYSVERRGEYRVGQSVISIPADEILPPSTLASLPPLLGTVVEVLWDDAPKQGDGQRSAFIVGEAGVGEGLLALCSLMSLASDELVSFIRIDLRKPRGAGAACTAQRPHIRHRRGGPARGGKGRQGERRRRGGGGGGAERKQR